MCRVVFENGFHVGWGKLYFEQKRHNFTYAEVVLSDKGFSGIDLCFVKYNLKV